MTEPDIQFSEFLTSFEINELAAALSKAQGVMEPAVKGTKNTFFKSSYADLGAVRESIRKPFADNGLSIVQGAFTIGEGLVMVRTRLLHSSGQWMESVLSAEAKDLGPQAVGSVITYLRRYGISAMAGVATEDDDGEAAERPREDPTKYREPQPARPPIPNWKKPPDPRAAHIVCEHGVSAPNKCLECDAHGKS